MQSSIREFQDLVETQTSSVIPKTRNSLFKSRFRVFWRSPVNRFSLVFAIIIVLLAFIPTAWLPHNPTKVDLSLVNLQGFWVGNWEYPLGTDFLGRDMLSRVIHATRLTLFISFTATILASVFGLIVGLIAGYWGGWLDEFISLITDIQFAFPVMILALAIITLFGGSLSSLIIVLAITSWATLARIARSQTLSVKTNAYVDAAKLMGAPTKRILKSHIFPNIISPVIAVATFEMSRLVLIESALSFLGLGVASPNVTWGGMIGDGQVYVYNAWWTVAVPGFMILLQVTAFNFIGDGIRDAYDPMSWQKTR